MILFYILFPTLIEIIDFFSIFYLSIRDNIVFSVSLVLSVLAHLALQCCSWGGVVGAAALCGQRPRTSLRRTETNHLAGGPWDTGERAAQSQNNSLDHDETQSGCFFLSGRAAESSSSSREVTRK